MGLRGELAHWVRWWSMLRVGSFDIEIKRQAQSNRFSAQGVHIVQLSTPASLRSMGLWRPACSIVCASAPTLMAKRFGRVIVAGELERREA